MKSNDHTTLDSALYGYNAGNHRLAFTNAARTYLRFTYDKIGQLKVTGATNTSGVIISGETKAYSCDKAWNLSQRVHNSSS
ncbi:MAG: hypothetical protein U1F83_17925 [Verrucomicrobiota bacterium]